VFTRALAEASELAQSSVQRVAAAAGAPACMNLPEVPPVLYSRKFLPRTGVARVKSGPEDPASHPGESVAIVRSGTRYVLYCPRADF